MSIKVGSTTVIDDNRVLQNVDITSGEYTNLHPTVSTTTNTINFSTPMMKCVLTANTTFGESGIVNGSTATLMLDITDQGYTPTFSSKVIWPGGTTPTWGDYRYWIIVFTVVASDQIRAMANGFDALSGSPAPQAYTLTGTSGSPTNFETTGTASGNPVQAGWRFKADGTLQKYNSSTNSLNPAGFWGFASVGGGQWSNVQPSVTPFLRVTNQGGDTSQYSASYSEAFNVWHAMSGNLDFEIYDSRNRTLYADENAVMKAEIAEANWGTVQYNSSTYYVAEVDYVDGEGFPDTFTTAEWNNVNVNSSSGMGIGGSITTVTPGMIWYGSDGNWYKAGTFQGYLNQGASNESRLYSIYQASFSTIEATGYYEVKWFGLA